MSRRGFNAGQRTGGWPVQRERVDDRIRRGGCTSSLAVPTGPAVELDSAAEVDAVRGRPRDRVTIDLRGIGPALHAHAAERRKTVAASVRLAVVAMLDAAGRPLTLPSRPKPNHSRALKVTLRLDAVHALQLADRARSADVSQGAYVAALLDGIAAAPRPHDQGAAIAALVDSTQKVAAMSADLHAFIRLIRDVDLDGAQRYRAGFVSLAQDMRLHLQTASGLMAGLTSRYRGVHAKPSKGPA